MNKHDFEGSAVLEKLAEKGILDSFFEAVDADDFETAKKLMIGAGVDHKIVRIVLNKMADADGEH